MAKAASDETIRSAEVVFRDYLRSRGQKFTDERRELLRAIMRMDEHVEAERLLLALRESGSRVGKATIYRTLPLLVACGVVKPVQLASDRVHYEHTFGQDPHDHMLCRRCGRIIEFDAADVVRLRSELARQHRFHALSHRLQIIGLCEPCLKSCPAGGPRPTSTARRRRTASK
ncbi:MAG: transcriptional repressor [Phycisphaerae bacterium]